MRIRLFVTFLALMVLAAAGGAAAAQQTDANGTAPLDSAGALYTKSVDLANEGKYQEALDAADQALAVNVTSLYGLIQADRSGILVMLHRYDDAIAAADAAIGVEGNLTTVHSVAWYNRGNALRALGRLADARDSYERAYALDNSLIPPDMSADVTATRTEKSPFPAIMIFPALGFASGLILRFRNK